MMSLCKLWLWLNTIHPSIHSFIHPSLHPSIHTTNLAYIFLWIFFSSVVNRQKKTHIKLHVFNLALFSYMGLSVCLSVCRCVSGLLIIIYLFFFFCCFSLCFCILTPPFMPCIKQFNLHDNLELIKAKSINELR